MRSSFAPVWAVSGVAAGLLLAVVHAAEPPHPLMGATRDQVLARYGEPKGQIAAGNRTVLTYARERLVLRDNVVVDIEQLASEPVRRPAPAPAETVAPAAAAVPASAPAAPHVGTENPPTPAPNSSPTSSEAASVPVAPPPEPKLEIKLVRPPSAGGLPAPRREVSTPAVATPPPGVEEVAPAPAVAAEEPPAPPKPDPAELAKAAAKAAKAAQAAAEAAAQEKRLKAAQSARRRLDFAETSQTEEGGTGMSILLGLGVLAGGIGALVWWRRQQSITLAATSVAATPVKKPSAPAPSRSVDKTQAPFSTTISAPAPKPAFTREFIGQLDPNRFEELVAAYFTKTGVVATRTKSGATSSVHIRISWKGEPRAFACAQCLLAAAERIDARALHPFVAALAAEDLRRGYVVTNGVFSEGATEFAAAKRITLMSVDSLIEKINGLPESARSELLQVIGAAK